MELSDTDKVQVLLSLLNERHADLRAMRERVRQILLSLITIFLLFTGWHVQSTSRLSFLDTLFLVVIISVFWFGFKCILKDIQLGFINSQNALIRIEKCLRLYEANIFIPDNESLLPESFKHNATGKHIERYIRILNFSAIMSILILLMDYIVHWIQNT